MKFIAYIKNIISSFAVQILGLIIGFIVSALIARSLGPENQGGVSYFILIFGMIASYVHIGINNATIEFQKKYKSEEEVYNTNNSILIVLTLLIFSAIFILKSLSLISSFSYSDIFIGFLYVLFTQISTSNQNFYVGKEMVAENNKFIFLSNIIKLFLIVTFVYLGKMNSNLYLLILVITMFIYIVFQRNKIIYKFRFKINFSLVKKEIIFGFNIYLANLFIFLNYRLDQFLIKYYLGKKALGLYSISATISELIFIIPTSVGLAFLGRLYNIDDETEKRIVVNTTIKATFYITMIVSLIGILMTPLVVIIYGDQYVESLNSIRILFLATWFASIPRVGASYLVNVGKQKYQMLITLAVLIINAIFNTYFTPRYGIDGAAISSLISYFIYSILFISILVKLKGFSIKELLIINRNDISNLKRLMKSWR